VQGGDVSGDEFAHYFSLTGFGFFGAGPAFRLNETAVNVEGLEKAARTATPTLARAANKIVRKSEEGPPLAPGATTILAEGDSWFNLPAAIAPPTLVDILQAKKKIANIAMWGDTLAKMIAARQYKDYLEAGGVRYFLLSAGGNDVLGNIGAHLAGFNAIYINPKQASYYIKKSFFELCNFVEGQYRQLLKDVAALSPDTKVLGHGYDYAFPSPGGFYLGAPMANVGLDCRYDGELCAAIIRLMVDEWNRRLAGIQKSHANFVHVDVRGTVGAANQWFDELHPKEPAAKRLAAKLGPYLA
jgi:hypothetical protein